MEILATIATIARDYDLLIGCIFGMIANTLIRKYG